jgi:membrane associated rhomboid family serine protease
MSLIVSAILFAVFAANVALGSSGRDVFLTDVHEMLVLFAAVIAFVSAIVQRESATNDH